MNDLIIQNKIYDIRGQKVMLDRDLAELYGVTTGALNQAVKRNKERFPEDFMFRLTNEETQNWKSQNVITNSIKMGVRHNPFAFTELGVAMFNVLSSKTAIKINMSIMLPQSSQAFKKTNYTCLLNKNISSNKKITEKFRYIETLQYLCINN